MSQQGKLSEPNSLFETLTGNTGGPVSPDTSNNIDLLGSGFISVSGNPATFTLTISDDGTVATTFTEDTGTATPSGNNLNVIGDSVQGSVTSGTGATITITNSDATTSQKGVLETSTAAESIAGASTTVAVTPNSLGGKLGSQTSNTLPYGNGSSGALQWMSALNDGQLVIGSTGGVPAPGSLTSTGGTITVSEGTNTLNIETDGTIATSYETDSGTAVPDSGVLTVAGGTGINTAGASNTITINLDSPVTVANGGTGASTLTGVLTGNGTSAVTANAVTQYTVLLGGASNSVSEVSGVGTSGQLLTSNGAGSDPTWQDAPSGGTEWQVEAGTTNSIQAGEGVFCNNAAGVTVTLPSTAAVGDSFQVVAMDAAGFTIDYGTGQSIQVGGTATTTTSGTIVSTGIGDWVEIVCNVTDDGFFANVKQGNLTLT